MAGENTGTQPTTKPTDSAPAPATPDKVVAQVPTTPASAGVAPLAVTTTAMKTDGEKAAPSLTPYSGRTSNNDGRVAPRVPYFR